MMPPAQDKTLEKDGRIRVSPPVLTRASDSSRDPDPPIATLDVGCARLWLNLASFSVVDSCSMKELPEIPNSTSDKADLQRSLGHLLGRVSTDESGADCPTLPEDTAFRKQSRNDHPIMASTLPIYQGESDRSVALKPVWDSHSAAPEDTDARRALLASQHAVLVSRAERAKLRLRALLGENALQTLNRQMSWKLSSLSPTSDALRPAENMCINALGAQEEASCLSNKSSGQTFSRPPVQQRNKAASMEKSSTCVQLRRLALCGQAVLHDALRALDSDATDSSSDDDWDTTRKRPGSGCLGCEWRAQRDRAELASQWTWMKLRLSELDLQIKTVSQLHQNLLANKGGVVLAEAQPLTDLQIQQTLLTETAGLTLTAGHTHDLNSELDAEPSSPTRLLRNIERQSAQLSRIVNSLMSPLSETPSHCPVDKGDSRCWRGSRKRSFTSSHVYSTCIAKTDHKKRRMSCRGPLQSQVDVSRVCARTRPVLTYHKPRLFIMDQSGVAQQGAETPAYRWPCATDPMCWKPVPVSSTFRPYKIPVSHIIRPAFYKETRLRRPPRPIVLSSAATAAQKRTPSVFKCTHEATPTQTRRRTATRRRRTDADSFSPRPEDGVEDASAVHYTNLHQRRTQFQQRRRNDESVYNVNSIVIPMSPAAPSTAHYKDIPTPSWRVVELSPLVDEDVDESESLSDEVFIQRHQIYERREKLCWSSWGKGRRFTCKTSSTDGAPDRAATPRLRDTPADAAEEVQEAQPWERRMFSPNKTKTQEETVRCNEGAMNVKNLLRLKNQETEPSVPDGPFKNLISCPGHTPPPGGHRGNNKCRMTSTLTHPDSLPTMYHRNRSLRSRK